ncbi:Hypothetical protein SMAX5B_007284 [Scophthalmus maximus]|uniref:Uncharacterized protein n=1 Tax=Scophthalmus maximus TaxID=52904 RepID=A0A2U9BQT2_SCOMX|nr:Hypothetical protein SMAX5B_007284 [Scophthalmus maximus]
MARHTAGLEKHVDNATAPVIKKVEQERRWRGGEGGLGILKFLDVSQRVSS